ncbi:MAG TPA: RDD family protein [Xanthomonadaceae bacterium]|nr:RDD family protein [Xanthomonadaceae bacterium]
MRRMGALFIDSFILGGAFYAVLFVTGIAVAIVVPASKPDPDALGVLVGFVYLALLLLYYVGAALYYALQESSSHQATLGKRALGIKVTDARGRRLGRGQAFGRWFAASLSYLTFYIGFLMAAFTERKRALHDVVADTQVVDRWAFTDMPERQQRHVGAAAIVVAVMAIFILVAILGILAAIAIPAYQDYTVRAKVATAVSAATPLEGQITAFLQAEGRCPVNGEAGIGAPDRYADRQSVASIAVGAMDATGHCAIEATLRDARTAAIDGKRVWLEYDPATGAWQCSSEVEDRYLPTACRG